MSRPALIRVMARAFVAATGSAALVFLFLLAQPLESGRSVAVLYGAAVVFGLLVAGVYEAASLTLAKALSVLFGRGTPPTEPAADISVLSVRGGVLTLLAYFGGMIATVFVAGLAMMVASAVRGASDEIGVAEFAWIMPLAMIVGALLCVALLRRLATPDDRTTFRQWTTVPSRFVLLLTVGGGIGFAAVAAMLLPRLVPVSEGFEPGILAEMGGSEGWVRLSFAAIAILLAPPIEEFVFRGVLLEGFLKRVGRVAAVAVTVAVFSAVHLPDMWGYWPGILAMILGATALAELRIRTGSLVAPVVGHASYNATLVVLGFVMGG